MTKFYLLILFINLYVYSLCQETVGKPDSTTSVSSYTGWSYQGLFTYTGNAEVQDSNSSNYKYASGEGNVFFVNKPGTYLQIGGFPKGKADGMEINFGMFGYDTSDHTIPNDLMLSVSLDSGLTWRSLQYHRFLELFYPPMPWDLFDAGVGDSTGSIDISKVVVRFEQTVSTKSFRIDDITFHFISLLPITLQSFTATTTNSGRAILHWQATTNNSNELFIIQKSSDGTHFSTLSQQSAKGVGNNSYTYNDEVNSNKTFYRLNMINAEGKSSYSGVVMVNPETNNSQLVQIIYPIPVRDRLHIQINGSNEKKATLVLTDIHGKQLIHKTILLKTGINNCDMNMQSLTAGNYYLTITTTEQKETHKIIVSSR